tara:strand:+ start:215 stop:991 length:777 start_codon:yes stop_codon:yes gene_type:complete
MLYNQLANNGRFGDTQIREVNGELSHVNDIEAYLIDNYGRLGELITLVIGSGTTNPTTGMKEYWIPQLIGTVLSVGGPLWAANEQSKNNDLETNMAGWQDNIDELNRHAEGLMNRESQFNQDFARTTTQTGMDNLAFQNMLNNRNQMQGGIGGYTGIRGAQNQANLNRTSADIMTRINQGFMDHYTKGLGLKQDVGQGLKEYGEMKTSRDVATMSPHPGDILGQIGGGVFNFAGGNVSGDAIPQWFSNWWEEQKKIEK